MTGATADARTITAAAPYRFNHSAERAYGEGAFAAVAFRTQRHRYYGTLGYVLYGYSERHRQCACRRYACVALQCSGYHYAHRHAFGQVVYGDCQRKHCRARETAVRAFRLAVAYVQVRRKVVDGKQKGYAAQETYGHRHHLCPSFTASHFHTRN